MKPKAQGSKKKPYQEPRLRLYGDVGTMTQAVGSTAKKSDGKSVFGKPLKTH